MSFVGEAVGAKPELAADLKAGIDTLARSQQVTFVKYIRLVLPLDGFVFWVKSDLVSAGARYNAARFNAAAYNQPPKVLSAAATLNAQGSLHYATELRQDEEATYSVNEVIFTSEVEVQDFNEAGPNVMFVAAFIVETGETVRFAFSRRGAYYVQADLYHYRGNALYSTMETQIIDSIDGFRTDLIVSDSLPLWLSLNQYQSPFPDRFAPVPLPLYPSYAVPQNLPPPFAAVHVAPESTEAIQAAPVLDADLNHWQLVKEKVRITLYGLRNADAMAFIDCVNQWSLDTDQIGIMNLPAIRDEKQKQTELGILAQKKTVEYEVNYYQQAARDIARQLILSCIPTFDIADYGPYPR